MKRITPILVTVAMLAMLCEAAHAAPMGEIFDFSQISINEESGLPVGWGNLGGTRESVYKNGTANLSSGKTYLEITNNASTGAWSSPPVYASIQQIRDYVSISKGDLLLMTAAVMICDTEFYQVGLVAQRANIQYVDVEGKSGSVADADFRNNLSLLAFRNGEDGVWLESWGQDITPEGFCFETNRFYKLDVIMDCATNTMEAYLDGNLIETVDFSNCFSAVAKANVQYDFNDETQYTSYSITQLKRLGIIQHKPNTYTGPLTCGWYRVGYMLYSAEDNIPDITFAENDLIVDTSGGSIKSFDGERIIIGETQLKAGTLKKLISGSGTVAFYKDKACTERYDEDEWMSCPAYVEYCDGMGFRALCVPVTTLFYADDLSLVKTSDGAKFAGKMVNISENNENAVVIVAGYSENVLKAMKMLKADVGSDGEEEFSVSIDQIEECDAVLAWVFNNWNNRNILSGVYRLDI